MSGDLSFLNHLKLVQAQMKVCNMQLERLLARLKKSLSGKHPQVERVVGAGVLTQYQHLHLKAGGTHPAAMKRKDLIADGVPLVAAEGQVKDGRKSRPNLKYLSVKYKEFKDATGQAVSAAEYHRTALSSYSCCILASDN